VGRPGSVVVESKVVVEQLGGLKDAFFEVILVVMELVDPRRLLKIVIGRKREELEYIYKVHG
jgi:hypothetical protein